MASQLPDRILLDGEYFDLYSNPLEQYWNRMAKRRPSFHSLPHCRRGYVATWEMRDNQLFLQDVDGNFEKRSIFFLKKCARYTLKALFPRHTHELVKAIWFSGKIRIPQGRMIMYAHSGYDSRFEKEMIISVNQGDITKKVMLDFTQTEPLIHSDRIVRPKKDAFGSGAA